jgi:hypothetical protein
VIGKAIGGRCTMAVRLGSGWVTSIRITATILIVSVFALVTCSLRMLKSCSLILCRYRSGVT